MIFLCKTKVFLKSKTLIMDPNTISTNDTTSAGVIPSEVLLHHWQGHRKLTRRMIQAFPPDKFFNYSIGGMRPFSGLVMEMIRLAAWGMHGISTSNWELTNELRKYTEASTPATQEEILKLWDEVTDMINKIWTTMRPDDFQRVEAAFGQYEGPVYSSIMYWIDNEIHHRGQGYVYLRSLGIEPPPFWDRD
jgi:uncharacterized damage-inducible protein DinB